jgi:hypothetical protein
MMTGYVVESIEDIMHPPAGGDLYHAKFMGLTSRTRADLHTRRQQPTQSRDKNNRIQDDDANHEMESLFILILLVGKRPCVVPDSFTELHDLKEDDTGIALTQLALGI